MAVSIIGGREGQVRWCSCRISRAGSYRFWEGTEAPAGDVTRPGWHSRPRSTGAGSPGSFSPPPWWQWGPSEPVRHRPVSRHHAQIRSPFDAPGVVPASPGTGAITSCPDHLPSPSPGHHLCSSPGERRAKDTPTLPPSRGVSLFVLSRVICCPVKAINMPRPVESTLGDGPESQGCGQPINGPGARPRPDLGSLHKTLSHPMPRGRGSGRSHAERDKHIPMGWNHFLLTVPNSGGARPSLCVLSKKGKLPVCEGKSPPNNSMALGHQSGLTKQHPNGLSINESGTYGSHLP